MIKIEYALLHLNALFDISNCIKLINHAIYLKAKDQEKDKKGSFQSERSTFFDKMIAHNKR
jgi:hypothetical protein